MNTKITKTRHFKKIAAAAMAMVMAGTMLVLTSGSNTKEAISDGTTLSIPSVSNIKEDLKGITVRTLPVSSNDKENASGGTALASPSNSNAKENLSGFAGSSSSADIKESGTCGENAAWTLDIYGRLIISGTGAMDDLINDDMQPWRDFRSSILSVEIEEGITTVGKYAFAYCTHMSRAYIAKSVTAIGADAFDCCIALTSANIPEGVASIGFEAFYQCRKISDVNIPSTVTEINNNAFFGCTNCKTVNIAVTDPGKLTWKDSSDDFMPGKQTQCTVPQGTLDGYNEAFGSTVNVTFAAAE